MLRVGDSDGVAGRVLDVIAAPSHFGQSTRVLISPKSWDCRLQLERERRNPKQGEKM